MVIVSLACLDHIAAVLHAGRIYDLLIIRRPALLSTISFRPWMLKLPTKEEIAILYRREEREFERKTHESKSNQTLHPAHTLLT